MTELILWRKSPRLEVLVDRGLPNAGVSDQHYFVSWRCTFSSSGHGRVGGWCSRRLDGAGRGSRIICACANAPANIGVRRATAQRSRQKKRWSRRSCFYLQCLLQFKVSMHHACIIGHSQLICSIGAPPVLYDLDHEPEETGIRPPFTTRVRLIYLLLQTQGQFLSSAFRKHRSALFLATSLSFMCVYRNGCVYLCAVRWGMNKRPAVPCLNYLPILNNASQTRVLYVGLLSYHRD